MSQYKHFGVLYLWAVVAAFLTLSNATEQPPAKRVAVIGAGAGGSFTAYELRKQADAAGIPVNITVFERNAYIGGRSTTVNAFNDPAHPIELGASIFVQVNANLVNASRDLGLNMRSADYARPRESSDSIGIWDGESFVFALKDGSNWWNLAKLVWRYGLAPLKTQSLVKKVVGRFLHLYEEPLFPFESLSEVAEMVGLLDVTSVTGEHFLGANGISELFAREIIQASTRVNYGQNLVLIHGLESMVCMATDGAIAVEGGNWRIFDGALKAAGAAVRVNTSVTAIQRDDEKGIVQITSSSNSRKSHTEDFDEVVIAAPFQYSGISVSPSLPRPPDEIPFVNLYVTLFASPHRISPQFFGLDGPDAQVPETILTTLPNGKSTSGFGSEGAGPAGFWSISTLRTVTRSTRLENGSDVQQDHYVYKIFSPERPTAQFIAQILGLEQTDLQKTIADLPRTDISWFHEKFWNPYPLLYPRVTFEETRLAPRVWYTGGIESFISTMETSALMGRNVATLMLQLWQVKQSKTNAASAEQAWQKPEL
ncbi:Prenylcysteine oxidase [Penicillium riverlandense]|uniref:Prenylcysteine oxidase n=1 Tax=Penicillium riverlandense TaxID=1903569 RepID=UPI002547E218|nr:Prenylcysteine oxidase [Penicillium riverlandense]KAJ5808499.1 Prenylcysteine oxidase [Penicillium riverlandense]